MTIYEHLRNNVGIHELKFLIGEDMINWTMDKSICKRCADDCGGECPYEYCPFVETPSLIDVLLASDFESFDFYKFFQKYEGGLQ